MKKSRKNIVSEEEKLNRKRKAEQERYKNIKNDPVKREEQRQKERLKYLKKKEKKIVKPIKDQTPREQRKKRKQWRVNSKNYRTNLKAKENQNTNLQDIDQPDSVSEIGASTTKRTKSAMKRAMRFRKRRNREFKKKDELINKLRRDVQKYRKRCERLQKNKSQCPPTPSTRVKQMLRKEVRPSPQVVKTLLFAEAIKDQLNENYKKVDSDKEKQLFKKIIAGKVIKKYRLYRQCSNVLKCHKALSTIGSKPFDLKYERKTKKYFQLMNIRKDEIENFLELDSNSRICPGKKDFITKKKVTKQKRYLNDTLRNLHKKFLKDYPDKLVSYEFFCRHRPFWVKPMRVSDRDTCKCITHINMELLIKGLFKVGVLGKNTTAGVVEEFCCVYKTEKCLLRECDICMGCKSSYSDFIANKAGHYFKWMPKKESFFDTKILKEKTVIKMTKGLIETTIFDMVQEFEKHIICFLKHEGRALHQYNEIVTLKTKLAENEALVHMDFSENYSLKYAEETQSFHFGGSRQQISLHTVVVYSRESNGELTTKCFSTLSESLQHNVPAIWAHLQPVLNYIENNYEVDTLHFLSDSPATQYRNKTMFYVLATKLDKFYPKLKKFTWNYLEAGHGKGAPDGVGAVCKRTADRLVAEGNDVASFETLITTLTENVLGIDIIAIANDQIESVSLQLEQKCLKRFYGTMQVHQVVGDAKSGILSLRNLSCFKCQRCIHYEIGTLRYESKISCFSEDELAVGHQPKHGKELRYEDVYSSSENDEGNENNVSVNRLPLSVENLKTGTFVLIQLTGNKFSKQNRKYRYVAVCQNQVEEDGDIKVMYFRVSDQRGIQLFKRDEDDVSYISFEQIVSILPEPSLVLRGNRVFYKFPTAVDVFEQH